MRAELSRVATRAIAGAIGVLAISSAACVPPRYVMPRPEEPHALVKVRRSFHQVPGPLLRERVLANGHRLLDQVGASGEGVRNDGLRVHPGGINWEVSSFFYHTETRLVRESYQEQVPYTAQESYTERYACGTQSTGFGSSRQTTTRYCNRTRYRTVTRYRSRTKYRNVHRTVEAQDGSCRVGGSYLAEVGKVYLLQYDFSQHAACNLSCFEQVPVAATSEFQNKPCQAVRVVER